MLDELFSAEVIDAFRAAVERFVADDARAPVRYPVQGDGRVEHMLPFASPFNDTLALHAEPTLRAVVRGFLRGGFKVGRGGFSLKSPDERERARRARARTCRCRGCVGDEAAAHPAPNSAAVLAQLELLTVIDSTPGSRDQRWHQGWRTSSTPRSGSRRTRSS